VQEACEESLKNLKTEYLDLFLIHWPSLESKQNEAVFEQLLLLQKQGKIKKI
jgi:diketogulonate reductase-like aldo/keto reductase